jgi:hypothetical protein
MKRLEKIITDWIENTSKYQLDDNDYIFRHNTNTIFLKKAGKNIPIVRKLNDDTYLLHFNHVVIKHTISIIKSIDKQNKDIKIIPTSNLFPEKDSNFDCEKDMLSILDTFFFSTRQYNSDIKYPIQTFKIFDFFTENNINFIKFIFNYSQYYNCSEIIYETIRKYEDSHIKKRIYFNIGFFNGIYVDYIQSESIKNYINNMKRLFNIFIILNSKKSDD